MWPSSGGQDGNMVHIQLRSPGTGHLRAADPRIPSAACYMLIH